MKPTTHFIIVDDDAINNMMCKFSISKHFGHAKISAFDKPEAALEDIEQTKLTENLPIILFLDIHMPSMSGWDFLDRFEAFNEKIQQQFAIFILSGSVLHADKEMAAAHPFVKGFLEKPLTGAKLEKVFRILPDSFGVRCFE